ncbi:hypothetical protein SAMN05216476_0601 [Pseudomonas mediterranea]|uniref:Uncharacterized protein n=1 Tax=Pseudomonas mediterranea TaxID=183795 RepID=A0AAX2D6B9_9PSED|nr:hypothetical protein SAMN05216476_0601 [Pseudomonas mediterranea]
MRLLLMAIFWESYSFFYLITKFTSSGEIAIFGRWRWHSSTYQPLRP